MNKNNLPIVRLSHNLYAIGGNLFTLGGAQQQTNVTGQLTSALAPLDPTGITGAIGAVSNVGTGLVNSVAGMFGKEDSYGATLAKGMLDPLSGGPIGALLRKRKADKTEGIANRSASMDQYGAMRSQADPNALGVYAKGGELPRITQFNNGGTHEQNPLGGIPQGMGANGKPNLVEQGETKVGDFIYSDRLPIMGASSYLLPKSYEGKTFAEGSKLASKYSKERPYDPIAKHGQEVVLNRLKQANNEAIQMKEAAEGIMSPQEQQMKCGGHMKKMKNVYAEGGYTFTDY